MQGYDPTQQQDYPQPPQQQPQQPVQLPPPQAPQQTLGQVHDQAQMAQPGTQTMSASDYLAGGPGAASNGYLQQYSQALQAVHQMTMPAREPMADPQVGAPNILESLLTFGGANIAHHQAVQAYNNKAEEHNRALDLEGVKIASEMVNSRARSDALGSGQQIQMLNLQARLAQLQDSVQNHQINQARNAMNDAQNRLKPPGSMEGVAYNRARGLIQDENGNWVTSALPGPGAQPGSPGAKAGLPVIGGKPNAPGGVASSGPNEGELPEDYAARKAAEQKKAATIAIPTGSSRTMAETAPKVLDAINAVREDLKHVQTGAIRSRIQSYGTALGLPNPGFKQYQTDVGLLRALFMRMHVGSRGAGNSALLEQYKGMIDAGKDSPQNMGASLNAIEKYTQNLVAHGAQGLSTSTTSTPTSSATTSTASTPNTPNTANTGGVTPNGIRFRVIQ